MSENTCRRCGVTTDPECPQPDSCGKCPPLPCADCGEPDDRYCSCWVSLEGMSLADMKSVFAREGLSLNTGDPA